MSPKILFFAFLLASASLVAAQSLSPQLNAPRHGDAPQYVRVPYAVDGGGGAGCVWQISIAEGESFPVSFAVCGDTAERIEPGIVHTSVCRGDTLVETAFSGRLSSGTFANGGILPLRMSFGDSIHSKYSGAADYCGRLTIGLDGETYTHADASGIRVDEIASTAGLGWTLNAGGAITRSIEGRADLKYSSLHRIAPEDTLFDWRQGRKNMGYRVGYSQCCV